MRIVLPLALLGALAGSCTDDQCTRLCPPGQTCILSDGEELCLEANCGGVACAPGTTCVEGRCEETVTCTGCTAAQHCVAGICVDPYTSANVCDPLRECRRACGTNVRCLDACDSDKSATCGSCLDELSTCERRDDCDSGPYRCCVDPFCDCFPSAPGCGDVAACFECQQECAGDTDCFNACTPTDIVCTDCLQPLRLCTRDCTSDSCPCLDELCACVDDELEPDCAAQ